MYADLKEKVPGWKAERKDAPIEIEDPRKVDKPKEDDNVQEIEDPRKVDKPQEVEDPGKFYDSQEDMPEFLYSKKAEKVKAKSKYEIEIEQEFENQRRKQLEWEVRLGYTLGLLVMLIADCQWVLEGVYRKEEGSKGIRRDRRVLVRAR